jgi:hypothetical protein
MVNNQWVLIGKFAVKHAARLPTRTGEERAVPMQDHGRAAGIRLRCPNH